MSSSFLTALSGLNASTAAINSIGSDLANLNTTGYKGNALSFEDVVANVTASAQQQIGSGVSSPLIFKNFMQGTLQTTGGVDDAAIQGDGFFIVRSAAAGSPVETGTDVTTDQFTRAGDFTVDQNGILTTATGQRVQGWSLDTATNTVDPSTAIGDIIVPVGTNRAAQATTTFNASLNLDASAATGTTFSVPINVYDSLGNSHVVTATFTKDATALTWDATVNSSDPAVASVSANGPFTFTFNPDGSLASVTGSDPTTGNILGITLTLNNGANNMSLNWSPWQTPPAVGPPAIAGVGSVTEFAEASATSAISQDGLPAAQLTSVSVTDGGSVLAKYSNGTQQEVAQIALASIRNPDSLISTGNNSYALGEDTAAPVVGASSTGGRGAIVGGSLESSNVDMATEFTQLIIFQAAYGANARVITTADQISQVTVALIPET